MPITMGDINHLKAINVRMIKITRYIAPTNIFHFSQNCTKSYSKTVGSQRTHEVHLFPTTKLYKTGFFKIYTSTKTAFHNRLNARADMRIQLSSNKPKKKGDFKKCRTM